MSAASPRPALRCSADAAWEAIGAASFGGFIRERWHREPKDALFIAAMEELAAEARLLELGEVMRVRIAARRALETT